MMSHLVLASLLQGLAFPPGILLVGLVLAGIAAMLGRWRIAFALIAMPVAATVTLSLPWVADRIAAPLENRALSDSRSAIALRALPRTAVVLGGMIRMSGPGDRADDSGYDLSAAADRVVAAAHLWRAGQVDRLVLSGGMIGETSEAELMARFAGDLGVPRTAIVLESNSRTTRENAEAVANVLRANPLGPDITLVTSALHLPRATAEFRCAGLAPVGVPAEFEALGVAHELPRYWLPSSEALDLSRRALKEWLGALVGGCRQ
jgi:uncharacterized SAM-binding protein YcdF (DUF218 family)